MNLESMRGLRELSLFTGAGGGVLASRLLGWRTVAYVEWDDYCQSILRARIADGVLEDAPIFGDVAKFDGLPFRGTVDIVAAGFPCFVAGTMILTYGGYVPIEDVRIGNLVLTHKGRWRAVTATMLREGATLRKIWAPGTPGVVCTDEHPFYVEEAGPGWVVAKDLAEGTRIAQILPAVKRTLSPDVGWHAGRYLATGLVEVPEDHPFNLNCRHTMRGIGGRRNIPGCMLDVPPEYALAVLRGYATLKGDEHEGILRLSTPDKAHALGLGLLAQRALGVVADVRQRWNVWLVDIPLKEPGAMSDLAWKRVISNEPAGIGVVYNISVDEDESYVADGAIVHNCQAFSVAGKQEAQNDERNRWPDTVRIIREVRPRLAFLENVPGLLAGSHGYFGTILGDLAESGFDAIWSCLPAAAVGAAHRRDRLWVLARRND